MEFGSREGIIGRVKIELYYDIVPMTVNNFMGLVKNNYKGCVVHRIIPGFCVQTGDFTLGDGRGGQSIYGDEFADENFKVDHDEEGLLSMANRGPNTNSSQFFFTLSALPHLNGKHVVFGKVRDGLKVIKKLENYGTENGKPKTLIKIVDCGEIID